MLRRLTALFSIAALANPLCCCWGAEGSLPSATEAEGHGCCESGASAGEDTDAEENQEHTCPHDLSSALALEAQDSGKLFTGPAVLPLARTAMVELAPIEPGRTGVHRSGYLMLTGRHPPSASRLCRYLN